MHPFEVTFDNLTLRGWRRPGPGPRCLAAHGWLDNANTFLPLSEHLTDWDLIAVDLPGHGRSDHLPVPGWYHFIDTVQWMVRLIQHWTPDWIMGHSLGGGLMSMAAAVQPVRGALLLDALGPITSPASEAPDIFKRSLEAQNKPFRRRYYASYEEALERLNHKQMAERSLQSDAQGYYFAYDPRVKYVSRLRMSEEQIQAFLKAIKCPVHVQSYSGGILPPFAPLQERLTCLQKVQLVELEGSHHHHLENPAEVAAHILAFHKENHG